MPTAYIFDGYRNEACDGTDPSMNNVLLETSEGDEAIKYDAKVGKGEDKRERGECYTGTRLLLFPPAQQLRRVHADGEELWCILTGATGCVAIVSVQVGAKAITLTSDGRSIALPAA